MLSFIIAGLQGSIGVSSDALVSGVLGAIAGFATSFGLFRSRFTSVEKDIEVIKRDIEKEIRRVEREIERQCSADDRWEVTGRRQMVQLELLAGVARKLGVNHRITDLSAYQGETEKRSGPDV